MIKLFIAKVHFFTRFDLVLSFCVPLMIAGVISFDANAFPFGMDQLPDSPRDHQSLFIHWHSWACVFAFGIGTQMHFTFLLISVFVPILAFHSIISLYLAYRRRRSFLIDTARLNPYKLVYKVTWFSCLQFSVQLLHTVRMNCPQDWTLAKQPKQKKKGLFGEALVLTTSHLLVLVIINNVFLKTTSIYYFMPPFEILDPPLVDPLQQSR